jgi:hypothetical protein
MEIEVPRAQASGMGGRERARQALAFETPDRPPFQLSFRAGPEGGGQWLADWPARAGADVIEVPWPAAWPRLPLSAEEARVAPDVACAALLADAWPDPLDPALYTGLRRAADRYPDRALFQRIPGLYDQVSAGLGWDVLLATWDRDAALVGALMERAVTLAATFAGEALRHGADALVLGESLQDAGNEPQMGEILERWVLPFDRLLLEGPAHSGAAIVAWCPGADELLWDRFVAMGARLIGPLSLAASSLARLRDRLPAPVGLYGSRETGPILGRGQPEAIRRHVREIVAAAGPGLILAAPDLPPRTPMGALEAFLDAARECRY